jgi:hypothetical protein
MSLPEKWMPGGAYYESTLEKIKSPNGMLTLDSIPLDVLDEEMVLTWVSSKFGGLYYVPHHMRTAKVCKVAVEKTACSIMSVPNDVLDREMCLVASKGCIQLSQIPAQFLDEEMVMIYIANRKGMNTLGEVPVHLRTEKVCTEAYRASVNAMKYVPRELQLVVYEHGVQGDFEAGWKNANLGLASALGPPPPLARSYAGMQCGSITDAPLVRQVNEN